MPRTLKKRELASSLTLTLTSSSVSFEPYPEHLPPTPQQCRSVRDALLHLHGFPKEFQTYQKSRRNQIHPQIKIKKESDDDSNNGDDSAAADDDIEKETSSVLDGLINTLLSQNTTDANSTRAFRSLKSAFPTWQQVLDADSKSLENAIRCGGLAATKAARIKIILKTLKDKRGDLCLDYLRGMPVDQVKKELSQFKGIGPKTVSQPVTFT